MGLYAVFIRRPRYFRAFQRIHRKRESQHHVIDCETWRSRLRAEFRCTTADQTAAHPRLDRRRDDLCAGAWNGRARVNKPFRIDNLLVFLSFVHQAAVMIWNERRKRELALLDD